MRHIAFLIPIILVAFWSCTDSEAHEPVFGAELPAINFSVDPTKDTVLKTPGGALISIPAGSLEAGNVTSVSLEVKEAYTSVDMVRGGLQRESGDPLASSGMIYINVTGGQSVSIHKPISVSLPAKDAGSDLMVYKGQAGENALLNWTDPHALNSAPAQQSNEGGKALFQTRCAACHGGKDESTGPPLAWITRRRDRQWLYAFTRNNATLLWRGDGYSCYLFGRYRSAAMPLFKDLSDADLTSLYHYIDNASKDIDSNSVADHKRSFDSCVANDPKCAAVTSHPRALAPTEATSTDSTTAVPEMAVTSFYTFAVEKHGWYSVARKAGSSADPISSADAFPAPSDSTAAHSAFDPIQGCPCWCDESAYRRADSLSRGRPARPKH